MRRGEACREGTFTGILWLFVNVQKRCWGRCPAWAMRVLSPLHLSPQGRPQCCSQVLINVPERPQGPFEAMGD